MQKGDELLAGKEPKGFRTFLNGPTRAGATAASLTSGSPRGLA
jgi:hypothetical protein